MDPTFLTIFLAVSIPPKIGFGKKKNAEFALNAGLNSALNLYTRMFITHKTLALATKWEFYHSLYRGPGGCEPVITCRAGRNRITRAAC